MRKLTIAGASVNQTPLDWQNNTQNIIDAANAAKVQGIDFVCFPELCITSYGCEDLFLSEWLPEKALKQLMLLIPHTANICIAVGLPFILEGHTYNTICLIENQEIKGFVAKQFLAKDGVHYEPRWFTAWPRGKSILVNIEGRSYPFGDFVPVINGVKIGFEICEDAWRGKDRPGYTLCERDQVDLICNPSASHFALQKTALRETEVVKFGSKNFDCHYLYVNLLGNEAGRMVYDGETLLAYKGEIYGRQNKLSYASYTILSASIDFDEQDLPTAIHQQDELDKHNEFTKAVSLALFDYLRKSRSKGFVLSLSGGADSSSIAFLVFQMIYRGVKQLGIADFLNKINQGDLLKSCQELDLEEASKLICGKILSTAYQATINSSDDTYESAQHLAENIGATFHQWDINEEVAGYSKKIEKVLGRTLSWEKDDIALQNIQARSRSPIIWMLANIENKLLLTTSNRSEGDVGYATMDGDTSGSLAPIAGIDKHFIIEWMIWAEKQLPQGNALSKVNRLIPTAELRPKELSQTDEKDLMPYAILVAIERLAIRDRLSPAAVFLQLKTSLNVEPHLLKSYVLKFFKMWAINQWKRERIAPSFHLDDFNVDPRTWCRFPILSGAFKEELEELESL